MLSYLTTAPQTRPHFLRFTLVSKQLKAQFLIVLSVLIIIVDETTTDIICIKCKKDESEHPNEIVLCDKCGIGNTDKNVLFGVFLGGWCAKCNFSAELEGMCIHADCAAFVWGEPLSLLANIYHLVNMISPPWNLL